MQAEKTFETLHELTSYESGAVLYPDGDIWIDNWALLHGLPRMLGPVTVGLGEQLTATECGTPQETIDAMREYAIEDCAKCKDVDWCSCPDDPNDGESYQSWSINDGECIVTINTTWN